MIDIDRFVHVSFHIDANRVNARTALPHMNQLERWFDDGVILMQMSHVAAEEAAAGANTVRAQKARSHIQTLTMSLNQDERVLLQRIERILFPDGVTSLNEANDVEIVFNASKYGAILITADGGSRRQPGGMLGNRQALARLGITVMTDAEAVALVQGKITSRDERLLIRARRDGSEAPAWIGKD